MTIEPSYFSANGHNLLGIYHPPGRVSNGEAVLLCPPVFGEYLRSHGALKRVAQSLAARGAHALRFDYRGTGDSSGEFRHATAEDWLADVRAAISELRGISGVRCVRLVGVRLGGTFAALASVEDQDIVRVVMWDPVLDGDAYLRELTETHQRLLEAHVSPRNTDSPLPESGEILGYRVGDELLASLKALRIPDWSDLAPRLSCKYTVVATHRSLTSDLPLDILSRHGIEQRKSALDCNWNTFKESILLPGNLVSEIVDAVL